MVEVETPTPSPFARSLLFGYVAPFLYEGDCPLAERRAAALSLDPTLLAELLGQAELRELLDPDALAQVELELQRLVPDRHARDVEGVADLLRMLGPLTRAEARRRAAPQPDVARLDCSTARRAIRVRIAGDASVGRHRGRRATARRARRRAARRAPGRVPRAGRRPGRRPRLALRAHARSVHAARRRRARSASASPSCSGALHAARRVRPRRRAASSAPAAAARSGATPRCCGCSGVARSPRCAARPSRSRPRRSAGSCPPGSSVGGRAARRRRRAARRRAAGRGRRCPASALGDARPARRGSTATSPPCSTSSPRRARSSGPAPASLPGGDGWVALAPADTAPLLLPELARARARRRRIARCSTPSARGGGWFFRGAVRPRGSGRRARRRRVDDARLAEALWDLVWSGRVTNDTLGAAARPLAGSGRTPRTAAAPARAGPRGALRPARARRCRPAPDRRRWPAAGRCCEPRDDRPHAARGRRGRGPARPARRRHPRRRRWPSGSPAASPRSTACCRRSRTRPLPSRLRRRGARRRAVRAPRRGRPAAHVRARTVATRRAAGAVVLAATDPANPYGAALALAGAPDDVASGHKPGPQGRRARRARRRRASCSTSSAAAARSSPGPTTPTVLRSATSALAAAVRGGVLGRLTVQKADGESVLSPRSPLGSALEAAGFTATPQGLRLRA